MIKTFYTIIESRQNCKQKFTQFKMATKPRKTFHEEQCQRLFKDTYYLPDSNTQQLVRVRRILQCNCKGNSFSEVSQRTHLWNYKVLSTLPKLISRETLFIHKTPPQSVKTYWLIEKGCEHYDSI